MTAAEYKKLATGRESGKKRRPKGEAAERFNTTKEDYERLANEPSPVEIYYSIYDDNKV